MALIPSDAGLNLKLQNEALLQPIARTPAISADLPDLQTGQRFAARIQEVLPDNTYRALVAGKSITLSLPESVKSGDMLELVVLDRTPKTIIAQLAEQGGESTQGATLSRAAQTLGTLLTADMPDLRLGQKFTAKIQEVLQNNSYKALVDGKSVTLSLPVPVQAGDTLELQVIDRSPTTTVVRMAEQQPGPAVPVSAEPYPFTTLSRAGQMIGALVTPEGESPPAAPLNRGEPLLAQPPQTAAELAPALGKAVVQSGLFYESHQAQWVAGKLPLASLLQEPQGQHSSPAAVTAALASELATGLANAAAAPAGTYGRVVTDLQNPVLLNLPPENLPAQPVKPEANETASPTQTPALLTKEPQGKAKTEIAAYAGMEAAAMSHEETPGAVQPGASPHAESVEAHPQAAPVAAMPEDVRPLVQQQLDAAATQRMLWHGEVWPGQTMQWEIARDPTGGGPGAEAEQRWATTLRLTTPRLGAVDAALYLSGGGVRISLATPTDASAADLRAAVPALEQALASAGVPLLGIVVKHESG